MAVSKTIILIPSSGQEFVVPADLTHTQVQSMYAQNIPGISSMVATTTEQDGAEGRERVITFAPRTGNKG